MAERRDDGGKGPEEGLRDGDVDAFDEALREVRRDGILDGHEREAFRRMLRDLAE